MDRFHRRPPSLTETQLSLLARVASGDTITQAARRLHFSTSHAYNEVQRVKSELGVTSITALCMRAHALGYLSHPTGEDMSVHVTLAA